MKIPSTPSRAWLIAKQNEISVEEATEQLNALLADGKVIREDGTTVEGGGEYWSAPEITIANSTPAQHATMAALANALATSVADSENSDGMVFRDAMSSASDLMGGEEGRDGMCMEAWAATMLAKYYR